MPSKPTHKNISVGDKVMVELDQLLQYAVVHHLVILTVEQVYFVEPTNYYRTQWSWKFRENKNVFTELDPHLAGAEAATPFGVRSVVHQIEFYTKLNSFRLFRAFHKNY
jgi:hypothetical protein